MPTHNDTRRKLSGGSPVCWVGTSYTPGITPTLPTCQADVFAAYTNWDYHYYAGVLRAYRERLGAQNIYTRQMARIVASIRETRQKESTK